MVYLTGDTHGDLDRFRHGRLRWLGKRDIVVVLGDFGFVWDGSAEEQKKLICDQELQNCSKISEKVQKALELFEQIKRLHTQAEVDRKNCALATENTKKVRKQQEALEEQETQWKKQSEELAEVDKKLVLAENKKQEADAVSKEIVDVQNLRNQAEQCRKKAILIILSVN